MGAEVMDPSSASDSLTVSMTVVSMTTSSGGPLLGDSVGVEHVVAILCVIKVATSDEWDVVDIALISELA